MTALTAANVAVTLVQTFRGGTQISEESRKRNVVKLVFGDGALTYPAGGVPVPAAGAFGFKRFLEYLTYLDTSNGDAFLYKWDFVNQKIRIYTTSTNTELGSVAVAASTTLYCEAMGW